MKTGKGCVCVCTATVSPLTAGGLPASYATLIPSRSAWLGTLRLILLHISLKEKVTLVFLA